MKRKAGCCSYLKKIIFYLRTIKLRNRGRIMTDYHCQLAFLEGLQHALGDAYKDPREYTGVQLATLAANMYLLRRVDSKACRTIYIQFIT
jgi:hypothetical protein